MSINSSNIQVLTGRNRYVPDDSQWDWISVILGWALILTVTRRLLVTDWTDELYLTAYIVNLAFIFGLALGYSRFREQTVSFLAVIYGIFFIGWRLGLLQSSTPLWMERISTVFIRLSIIFQKVFNRQPVYDNLLFLLLIMSLFWIFGLNTSYCLARSKPVLRIILPLFATLIIIHTYDPLIPSRNGYLYVFSALSLFIIGRQFYMQQKRLWDKRQSYIPPQLSSEGLQFTSVLVLFLLLISFSLPASRSQLDAMVRAWEKIKEPFHSITMDFENAFSSLRATTITHPEFYERTLNLGRGNELSEEEIFTAIAHTKLPEATRIFWRSRIYAHYENGQWILSEVSTRDLEPNEFDVEFPPYPSRPTRLNSFSIYLNRPIQTLILPAQPYWTNLAIQIEYFMNLDGTQDLVAIRSQSPLPIGKMYSARSNLTAVSLDQLRDAGEEYPYWVIERYLQLPDTLTERTKKLALEITQQYNTPYDKAVAITEYLRTNITYIQTLEELPSNQDSIDWFLFDYKKGFCNYYATAEVLMLRSLGIPARLAVGFAEGTMEDIQTANVFIVRHRDAHAWVEVFFPNLGWIEFEPTSSQPTLSYPQQVDIEQLQYEISAPEIRPQEILLKLQEEKADQRSPLTSQPKGSPLFSSIIIILVITVFGIWIYHNRPKVSFAYQQFPEILENKMRAWGLTPPKILVDWNRLSKLSPVEKSYQRINTALSILGDPAPVYYTPSERASKLIKWLPEVETEISELIQLYQAFLYGKAANQIVPTKKLDHRILLLALQKRLKNKLAYLLSGNE